MLNEIRTLEHFLFHRFNSLHGTIEGVRVTSYNCNAVPQIFTILLTALLS